ncbi:putative pH-response regulator protein palF/rim-8 [Podospora fimiseda]|uniref:PH-response regulator protein palF/rim-8 n=1 Tax=Podospora fimiseda TaxID=252190 RepID=A0AAN7H459_9PEZI|nr:putative pH-response regulator protein palF/rim-8 [Podospora fimiseda]
MGYSRSADNRAPAPAPASAIESPASPAIESPADDSSPSRRSFFSRFSLPLRSRARNITDFHIRPAEPHRKYAAGDHVRGAVILTVVKPVRITHLTVALHGYMRVYKGPNVPANEPIINPSEVHGRNARQRHHNLGRLNLFEDEQILSADGKLEPCRYEFNFDLLFPSKGLPSSIDFERGTISYMITATLTRPSSMGTKGDQTTACERKIYLTERVDIGPLSPPRPRTIYLEPISAKRSRRKKQSSSSVEKPPPTTETVEAASDLDSTRANENSTDGSLSVVGEDHGHGYQGNNNSRGPGQSDVRSVSGDSARSCSTAPSRNGEGIYPVQSGVSQSGKKAPAAKDRTITATVELLRGGCLPGDMVPVRISVQHIRKLKSMHGVIVTLYRLGRIDSAPAGALSRELSQEGREKDEYYPRSKTGLGGLSLSSAGSCSVFRKDLSQVFTPLIIQDPETLSVTLTTSIRAPEDVFPTIKGVPGEMITFKYFIEVLVDLGGKLAGQIQGGNKLASTRVNNAGGPLGLPGSTFDPGSASLTSWGTSIIDTDILRREKGVISVVFEVVVGTTDSNRVRGKNPLKLTPPIHTVPVRESELLHDGITYEKQSQAAWTPFPETTDPYTPEGYPQGYSPYTGHHHTFPQAYPAFTPVHFQQYHPPSYHHQIPVSHPPPPPAPHYIPPPEIHDESNLTEKERVRRAEQRLLPSQPEVPAGSSSIPVAAATENIYDADDVTPEAEEGQQLETPRAEEATAPPSAPTLEELSGGNHGGHHGSGVSPTEDKQELERRRLLAEASAPPEFPEDYDDDDNADDGNGEEGGSGGGVGGVAIGPSAPPLAAVETIDFEPSAPVILDEGSYGPDYAYPLVPSVPGPSLSALMRVTPQEPLPRYER